MELEHDSHDPQTDVTGDDPILTGEIALAHMKEFPDYYERLEAWRSRPSATGRRSSPATDRRRNRMPARWPFGCGAGARRGTRRAGAGVVKIFACDQQPELALELEAFDRNDLQKVAGSEREGGGEHGSAPLASRGFGRGGRSDF